MFVREQYKTAINKFQSIKWKNRLGLEIGRK